MSTKSKIFLLAALLAFSIGIIIYLIFTNPVRGYKLLYSRNDYKLFVKENGKPPTDTVTGSTNRKTFTDYEVFDHGRRIPHAVGVEMIKKYRSEINSEELARKMTKFVDFTFDSVFAYMGYVLENQGRVISEKDTLGLRAYIGTRLEPSIIEGVEVYQHTVLFAPIKDHSIFPKFYDDGLDFFNQGSICPVNCPDDVGFYKMKTDTTGKMTADSTGNRLVK